MKMKKIRTVILIILLIISNIYFIIQSQKLDYDILIGVPTKGEDDYSDTVSGDFTNSKPLKEKDDVATELSSLINSSPIEKSQINDQVPDAVMFWGKSQSNIAYKTMFWLNESSIIFTTENGENHEYRKIDESYVTKLKNIIISQTNIYKKH